MKSSFAIHACAWGIALVVLALPIVGLLEGWFAVDRWPVRNLHVQAPLQHVSAAQIRAVVVPQLASGFFALDIDRVQRAVAALPWVEHAEVRKQWPDAITVRVYEQQPFAHWDGDQLINRHGALYRVPAAAALQGLPTLTGPAPRRDDVVRFYLRAKRNFGQHGLRVSGVYLSDLGAWQLTLAGGAQVMIGSERPQQRLARFLDTWSKLISGHRGGLLYADLRYPNGYAVRWAPPSASSTASPSTGASPNA